MQCCRLLCNGWWIQADRMLHDQHMYTTMQKRFMPMQQCISSVHNTSNLDHESVSCNV